MTRTSDERRGELLYRKLNQLAALTVAGLCLLALGGAIVSIILMGQQRRQNRRLDELGSRIQTLEQAKPAAEMMPASTAGGSGDLPAGQPAKAPLTPEPPDGEQPAENPMGGGATPAVPDDVTGQPAVSAGDSTDERSAPGGLPREADTVLALFDRGAARIAREEPATVRDALAAFETWRVGASDVPVNVLAAAARLYLELGRGGEAASLAELAVRGGDDRAATAYTLAAARLIEGDAEAALREAQRALVGAEPAWAALLVQARAQLALNQMEAAEASLRQALRHDVLVPEATLVLGEQLLARGAVDELGKLLRRARQMAPERHELARLEVLCLYAEGKFGACAELGSKVAEANPGDEEVLWGLGRALYQTQQAAQAAKVLRDVVELRPQDAAARELLGRALLASMEDEEAVEVLNRLTGLTPESENAWYLLGLAYANGEDCAAALEALGQALELNDRLADAYFVQAVCLARQGHATEAKAALARALSLDPMLEPAAATAPVLASLRK